MSLELTAMCEQAQKIIYTREETTCEDYDTEGPASAAGEDVVGQKARGMRDEPIRRTKP